MIRRVAIFLGITGTDGNISFNKTVTAVMCATFVYAVVRRLTPTWELLAFGTVIIGAGFGVKAYLAAIARNSTTATVAATSHVDVAAAIRALREPDARRDDERGE